MKRRILLLVVVLQTVLLSTAQPGEQPDKNRVYDAKQTPASDTTSLLHALKSGRLTGHARSFFMSTQNEDGLTDYYADALGVTLRYETNKFHHVQFAIGGFSAFNIASSNLAKPDVITGMVSRYEIGLFDITNLSKRSLYRLEELYLMYTIRESSIKAGRQFINTPFINLQDGRMNATAVEGVWGELNEIPTVKVQLGWLWGMSPRSTGAWYNPGKSIGLYSTGINPDGTKSGYAGNIKSNGIAIMGITKMINDNVKLQAWDMFTENVFNTAMLQTDIIFPLKSNNFLFMAAQIIKEGVIKYGGNENQCKTYFSKESKALSFGAKAGWRNKEWEVSLNYNRITGAGRYLFPREWGVEPFFTFLPRERNEGTGDVQAIMSKVNYTILKERLKTSLAAGYYSLPDVKSYKLNKYGMPSYVQVNADIRYIFTKHVKGLETEFLAVAKLNKGETYDNKKSVFNKVNMMQYNLIINYHFSQ
ncbi:MAG: OprD family outer membrane porin [Ginsengibacter sp.]